jgi:hypothetical protein
MHLCSTSWQQDHMALKLLYLIVYRKQEGAMERYRPQGHISVIFHYPVLISYLSSPAKNSILLCMHNGINLFIISDPHDLRVSGNVIK